MSDLLFILYRFSCFAHVELDKQIYLFGQIQPDKQEVSSTVILPPMVSALWPSYAIICQDVI